MHNNVEWLVLCDVLNVGNNAFNALDCNYGKGDIPRKFSATAFAGISNVGTGSDTVSAGILF